MTENYRRTLNIDEPLARIKADGTVRYYQTDALGSVIALTDETGVVKTTYTYDPFGNTTVSGEASDNPFQYTGRENDGTGLYYYRARYYRPELQRFISEDPIGLKGGINKFAYVKNNPIKYTDSNGKITLECIHFIIELIDWITYLFGDPPGGSKDDGECTKIGESPSITPGYKDCEYSCANGSRVIVAMPNDRPCPPSYNFNINPNPY